MPEIRVERLAVVAGSGPIENFAIPENIRVVLDAAVQLGATDIHITPERPVMFRISSELREWGEPWTDADTENAAAFLAGMRPDQYEAESVYSYQGRRLRIAAFRQRFGIGIAARVLPGEPLPFTALGLPDHLIELTQMRSGLVLVCGATGSGKSTSLAALLDIINHARRSHIITIEDPIEYVYNSASSLVQQREVGSHTEDFPRALRAALRQDPDVLLVGEMRDLETVSTAISAAETGHLVFSTIHASDAVSVIQRIVDIFPAERQQQVRIQLAGSLKAVICQKMFPSETAPSGRTVVCEIMMNTIPIKAAIREEQLQQIPSLIQAGVTAGSQPFELGLARAVTNKLLTPQQARAAAGDLNSLDKYLATAREGKV